MQFLNAIAVMSIAFSLPVVTAKPYIPKCVADPTILSSVPRKFALGVLGYDDQGRINSTAPSPIEVSEFSLSTGQFVYTPYIGPSQKCATIFSLKNKKLFAIDSEAAFLPQAENYVAKRGLQLPVFTPFLKDIPALSNASVALFTVREACDSYNQKFLRLSGPTGEYLSLYLTWN